MFFHEDIVDNFYMITNSEPNVVYPNNNNNNFSVVFPQRKDFMLNEEWEVAVTSLSIPYWITNPSNDLNTADCFEISLKLLRRPPVKKNIPPDDGYYTSVSDFVKSFKLKHPIFVFGESRVVSVDFDENFEWRVSPTTDRFILDTSALFTNHARAVLNIKTGYVTDRALLPFDDDVIIRANSNDQCLRSCNRHEDFNTRITTRNTREGWYYDHKPQVLVHSNLSGSPENHQKVIFHNAEINNPVNHTSHGTVHLIPERLQYHKITLQQFSHVNFKITDHKGDIFRWLHNAPVTIGLHFRKRYYINLYK